jgi:hypothetical protein
VIINNNRSTSVDYPIVLRKFKAPRGENDKAQAQMALSFFLEIQKLDDSKNMNIKKVSLEANRFQVFIEGEMIKYWRDLGEA